MTGTGIHGKWSQGHEKGTESLEAGGVVLQEDTERSRGSNHLLSSGGVLPTRKQNSRIIIGRFLKLALDKQQKCLYFNSLKALPKIQVFENVKRQ